MKCVVCKSILIPCPFCDGVADDLGHGITCRQCGVWFGDNRNKWIHDTGLSYKQRWNMRPYSKDAKVPSHNQKTKKEAKKEKQKKALDLSNPSFNVGGSSTNPFGNANSGDFDIPVSDFQHKGSGGF